MTGSCGVVILSVSILFFLAYLTVTCNYSPIGFRALELIESIHVSNTRAWGLICLASPVDYGHLGSFSL